MAEPRLEYIQEGGYIVFNTHDIDVALDLMRREHGPDWCLNLTPVRTWVHRRPPLKHERDAYGWTFVVSRGTPGRRGTVPAVEFPEDHSLGPSGRRAEEPSDPATP